MRILVTGASGFLGRHVVDALRRAGHSVRALIRPTSETKDLGWDDGVEIVRADLRGSSVLEGAFDGMDAAIHLAAVMTGSDSLDRTA